MLGLFGTTSLGSDVGLRAPFRHRTVSTSGPSVAVVSLDEAKLSAKIDTDDDDDLIATELQAATTWVEQISGTSLLSRTVTLYFDDFWYGITLLPLGPITAFTSITYQDSNNATQTLGGTNYEYDIISDPGRLRVAFGKSWPVTYLAMHAVVIAYVAGYANAGAVPAAFKTAIKKMFGSLYEFREDTVTDRAVNEVGRVCKDLIAPYRRRCVNP